MSPKEKRDALNSIENCLHMYSCYYIDWEEMYNNKEYHPEFPEHLIQAKRDLKTIAEELNKRTIV